ncbi:hypothetical protein VVR12_07410 [Rothia sp. LK2588]|uniref:hypothetical protein n=1 Tax=Rothia sp. LK2588 TaxID=3114369 RepID=UPI0034CDD1D0
MNYRLVSWAWGLSLLGLLFPLFATGYELFNGDLHSPKGQGSAAVLVLVTLLSVLGMGISKKRPGLGLILGAMNGVMVFATNQFLPSVVQPILIVVALIFFVIAIWSALEAMNRQKDQRASYID